MDKLETGKQAQSVQAMFELIAPRYDLMNRMMTFGQDLRWREAVIRHAELPPDGWLLDLGTGTGDLISTALENEPTLHAFAADFTLAMIRVGIASRSSLTLSPVPINWLGADAAALPFISDSFDAVVSGFLLRNVIDLKHCLSEQFRVLKPGGMFVALDTTPPPYSPLRPVLKFHLHKVIPFLGGLIARQPDAYRYLPETTEGFLKPEKLAARMIAVGFEGVGYERRMFGTIAIHWGRKPICGKASQ